ncbi:MAG: hypothetical protein DRP82_06955 [Planctomycetota bacterium]|nr:MAG: hypothetical protein DRP82_06955 [Planctomycetota bacterium]
MRATEALIVFGCAVAAFTSRAAFGSASQLSPVHLSAVCLAALVTIVTLWVCKPSQSPLQNIVRVAIAVMSAAFLSLAISFLGWTYAYSRMTLFFFFSYSFFAVSAFRVYLAGRREESH